MAAWALSPPFSTIEISRATDARSPARAPSTSASGSCVRAKKLDGFDGGDAGHALLQDALHAAFECQPGDGAGVAGPGQLHLDDALLGEADVVDVAPVHLQSRPYGVDGFEDGCFHIRPAYRRAAAMRSPG